MDRLPNIATSNTTLTGMQIGGEAPGPQRHILACVHVGDPCGPVFFRGPPKRVGFPQKPLNSKRHPCKRTVDPRFTCSPPKVMNHD